ncbi:MAG: hypothetical protein A2Y14_04810 [Verrucomicrobia bacterium GWF2_51_19]|nr:MAG: hypothetical protein A2Y14_04810 [Verrucomicrobia bacterium GWF2_51_19]
MRIIFRYLFNATLLTTLAAIGIFVFILLVGNAVKDVIALLASGQLSWGTFFLTMVQLIPSVASYALPIGFLCGILIVLGRMSSNNEITALKASGVSLWQMSVPLFWLAFLGILFSLFINFYYGPVSITHYRSSLANAVRDEPTRFIQAKKFIKDFPGYILFIGEKRIDRLSDFWIWELDKQQRVSMFLRADKGTFQYDADKDAIILKLFKGIGEKRSEKSPENFKNAAPPTLLYEELSLQLPLKAIFGDNQGGKRLGYMTLFELLDEQAKVSANTMLKPPDKRLQLTKIRFEIQKNFASAASVLSLILLAIPLALQTSRSETSANIGIALALGLIFYFLSIVVSWVENNPAWHPEILIWVPNALFLVLGSILFRRANRY